MTREDIAKELKTARESKGITQQELADKTGLTKAQISLYENARFNFGIDALIKIVSAIGCDLNIK